MVQSFDLFPETTGRPCWHGGRIYVFNWHIAIAHNALGVINYITTFALQSNVKYKHSWSFFTATYFYVPPRRATTIKEKQLKSSAVHSKICLPTGKKPYICNWVPTGMRAIGNYLTRRIEFTSGNLWLAHFQLAPNVIWIFINKIGADRPAPPPSSSHPTLPPHHVTIDESAFS